MTVLIENLFTYRERLTNGAQSFLANQSNETWADGAQDLINICLLYTSPSPRDATLSRMPSSA